MYQLDKEQQGHDVMENLKKNYYYNNCGDIFHAHQTKNNYRFIVVLQNKHLSVFVLHVMEMCVFLEYIQAGGNVCENMLTGCNETKTQSQGARREQPIWASR